MSKLPFQLEFQNEVDLKFKSIITNVFENFNTFLHFNNFVFNETKIIIGKNDNAHFNLSEVFKKNIKVQQFEHQLWFENQALIIENGIADYIGTCFYMINCLQEYTTADNDYLDRFDYKNSYQYKFNCVEKNLVLKYFQEMAQVVFGKKIPLKKSNFHLSHDIDFIYSAWKSEIKSSLKRGNLLQFLKVTFNKLKGQNTWQNIEQIIQLENQHNIKSTFFWLAETGKTSFPNIQNADYKLNDSYIQNCLNLIAQSQNHDNALHKSISSNSIDNELNKIPQAALKNRFHFLKFNIKSTFPKLENSKIEADYSLGFSEVIGFRNSHGLPFKPYNPITNQQYQFKVYPLHLMDSSMFYFMNLKTPKELNERIESFIKVNNESTIVGILIHNNFIELNSYQNLLQILKNNFRDSIL